MAAQMESMMKRKRKAFIIGTIDRVRAEIILLSTLIRPKSRITRKTLIKRSTVTGMPTGPSATSDMTTTKASSMLQGLHRKDWNGLKIFLSVTLNGYETMARSKHALRFCR